MVLLAADDSGPKLLVRGVALLLVCLVVAMAFYAIRWVLHRRR